MRIRQSDVISDLVAALAKFHLVERVAVKNRENKHLSNDYADLRAVIEASDVALAECGLVVTQTPYAGDDGATYLETMLAHLSGQYKAGDMRVPVVAQKGLSEAQQLGSALTYVMRYARKAVLGIADGYDDDDGNAAGDAEQRPPHPAPVDDVPFQVGPRDAEAMSRSPAPVRDPHPDAEIVKAIVASIGDATTVPLVRIAVNEAESMPLTDASRNVILLAAGQRMIGVATSPLQLAEVGEFLRQARDAGAGTEEWHAGAAQAYKRRRNELTGAAAQ